MKKCISPECNNPACPDDEFGPRYHCGPCEDRMIELTIERREWNHFHPPLDEKEQESATEEQARPWL